MKKIILVLVLTSIFCWQAVQNWPVKIDVRNLNSKKILSIRMPLKDKQRLEFFFRETCFLNTWAYTLLGSKPMSIDQYTKPWCVFRNGLKDSSLRDDLLNCIWSLRLKELCYHLTPKERKMQLGWNTLNKYVQYFPNSRFFLFSKERADNEVVDLLLVDKIKLIQTVDAHLEDFQDLLNSQSIATKALLQKAAMHQFLSHLGNNGLLGTLLGFGRENAWLFRQYQGLDPHQRPMISAWPTEETVNLEQLNQKTLAFQHWDLSDLFYPRFACDPESEETRQLKQTYREEREKIVQYFEGKDLVEAVLSLFSQESENGDSIFLHS